MFRPFADKYLGFRIECRALVLRHRQWFGLDHACIDQLTSGGDALDLLEAKAFEIAFAHVIPDVNRPFRRQTERFERGAAELGADSNVSRTS